MQGHGRMKWKGQNTVREAWKWKAFKGDKKKTKHTEDMCKVKKENRW